MRINKEVDLFKIGLKIKNKGDIIMKLIIDARVDMGFEKNGIAELIDACKIYDVVVIGTKGVCLDFSEVQAMHEVYGGIKFVSVNNDESIVLEAAKAVADKCYADNVIVSKDEAFRTLAILYEALGHSGKLDICRGYAALKEYLADVQLDVEAAEKEGNIDVNEKVADDGK